MCGVSEGGTWLDVEREWACTGPMQFHPVPIIIVIFIFFYPLRILTHT